MMSVESLTPEPVCDQVVAGTGGSVPPALKGNDVVQAYYRLSLEKQGEIIKDPKL